jgi:hypothetical protein
MNWRLMVMLAGGVLVLTLAGCSRKQGGGGEHNELLGQATGSTAGLHWSVPKRWEPQGQRPMRAATYAVPPAEGEPEAGECAVFYFGNDQGGSIDANIDRWVGQFDHASGVDRGTKDVNGMKVTTVKISGSYLAPSGPMMMPSAKKDNFKLLGAIVEGPQGSLFFKFTGPAKTVDASAPEFDALVGSLSK